MSLIINQGKQDTSEDNKFEIMISENEVAQITKIEMAEKLPNTLSVTFKVISEGKNKGRLFWDRVTFDPKSPFSWKYRSLRKAAGVPYVESESAKLDIEALLLNKAVNVKLGLRKGTDGNDYQSVTYKTPSAKPTLAVAEEVTEEETVESVETPDLAEDDLSVIDTDDTSVEW